MTRQIARDIENKVVNVIQDTMKRELAIAQHVMEPAEVAMLLSRIATGTLSTAAATIAGMVDEDARPKLYDMTIESIAGLVRAGKDHAMGEIAKRYSEARS
jgi:hypothetical protein